MKKIYKTIKAKSFIQRNFFTQYEKVIYCLSYLDYENDEREFIIHTYQNMHVWRERLLFLENALFKLRKAKYIEYRLDEVKEFLELCHFVSEEIKKMVEQTESLKEEKTISFNERTKKDYLRFANLLENFYVNVNAIFFERYYK
jgi:hypothetical protein